MILGSGRAPGKVILFGEHAVVYGRPALAVPVTQVQAEAIVETAAPGSGLTIYAADLGEEIAVRDVPASHPLAAAVWLALTEAGERGRAGAGERGRAGAGERESGSRGAGERESRGTEESQQPAASFQFPTSSFQLPVSSFQFVPEPDWRITVRSTIPIASGLGSGAAVSTAIVRAVVEATNQRMGEWANGRMGESANQRISESAKDEHATRNTQYAISPAFLSALVYEVEKLYHGTPSGIDNTVIAHGQPVYFVRGWASEPFAIGKPFTLAIADTGIRSPTKITVGDVRWAWEQDRPRFEALFDQIATVVEAARTVIAAGEPAKLGPLMDENHVLLQEIGVSCPELDALAAAARAAGALGAKLSGAGRGGNMIALVTDETASRVAEALRAAGAVRVIVTKVG
jgi:mevalonate kinase